MKYGNRTKAPRTKAPHNEIIMQSYYIFFYIDDDIKDILKIKTHPYYKGEMGELIQNIKYFNKHTFSTFCSL